MLPTNNNNNFKKKLNVNALMWKYPPAPVTQTINCSSIYYKGLTKLSLLFCGKIKKMHLDIIPLAL